jgi:glucokinase
MADDLVLAIDVGGTKLAAAVVRRDGLLMAVERCASEPRDDPEGLYRTLLALIARTLQKADVDANQLGAIGVGAGGPMEYPDGVLSTLNLPAWRHRFPLKSRLEETFRRPVIVDNDAKALALGEYWQGAGQGAHCLLALTVSTGVGGGIVMQGRLLHGASGNAGHVGHVIAQRNGPLCGCGARGCVEAIASGTGLARRARRAIRQGVQTSLSGAPSAEEIAAAAQSGDPYARQLFREAGQALGLGIASAAALLDLDRAVINGGILAAGPLFFEPLRETLERHARLDFTRGLQVIPSTLGLQANLVGAAALVFLASADR